MRTFTRISLGLAGATVLASSVALPASADDTAVAANIAAGTVSINVPDTASLNFGAVTPGTSPELPLTGVAVTDNRAGTAAWAASVQINGFTVDGTQPVDGFSLSYTPTTAASTGDVIDGAPTSVVSVTNAAAEIQRPVSVVGNNTATWDATVVLNVPSNALVGSYSTVLTHSVL